MKRNTLIAVAVLVSATVAIPTYMFLTRTNAVDPTIHSLSMIVLSGWAALIFQAIFGGKAKS